MKCWFTCLFTLFALTHLCAQTVPSLVNYQGRLLDSSSNPRSGNVSIALSVHTAATRVTRRLPTSAAEGRWHTNTGSASTR